MKRYTNKPPRWKESHSIYFLTFCTYRHKKILHRNGIPVAIIEDLKFNSKIIKELIAYTIIPDHIHLLVEVEDVKNTLEVSSIIQNAFIEENSRVDREERRSNLAAGNNGPLYS
jgi:REP element-mobilizing transposase RayT